jgi:hypothetical protein
MRMISPDVLKEVKIIHRKGTSVAMHPLTSTA